MIRITTFYNNSDNDNKNIDIGNYDIFIINQMLQFKKKE